MTFSRDGRRIASGSKDKSIRVYRETSSGQLEWPVELLLSSSRSLSFTDAAVTGVRMSAANKIVLDQHGVVIASDGRASNSIGFGALVVPDAQATPSNISGGGFNSGSTHQGVSDAPNVSITSAASASDDARLGVAKPGSQLEDFAESLGAGESESRSIAHGSKQLFGA